MNYAKYRQSLEKLSALDTKGAVLSTIKGDALADTVKLLFGDLKYLELIEEKKRTDTCEFDLIYKNTFKNDNVLINDFGRFVVVECKNWKDSIGASQVRDFAMKMQKAKVRIGFLFTKNGITGAGSRDAKGEIRFLFDKCDINIVVFDIRDLKSMGDPTKIKFSDLLESKLIRLQFSY